ncbi:hypothetical protein MTP99_014348, partial [Tenebrio molitor]
TPGTDFGDSSGVPRSTEDTRLLPEPGRRTTVPVCSHFRIMAWIVPFDNPKFVEICPYDIPLCKGKNESAEELQTRKYDEECMKYLCYLLYPLCASAAIYSLLYQPHKSWYSWTINSLVNGVDDVVFLIYLYQRWLYPVDKTRTDDVTSETITEDDVDSKKTK